MHSQPREKLAVPPRQPQVHYSVLYNAQFGAEFTLPKPAAVILFLLPSITFKFPLPITVPFQVLPPPIIYPLPFHAYIILQPVIILLSEI